MTARTPGTVSLLGFSTYDGQMQIIFGNYYDPRSPNSVSCANDFPMNLYQSPASLELAS